MSPITVGIIGILVLIGLLFTRMPVGFVMALVGVLGFSYMVNFKAALNILGKDIFGTFGSYSFTVIPLFVLMGQIAFHSGVSRKLFVYGLYLVRSLKGWYGYSYRMGLCGLWSHMRVYNCCCSYYGHRGIK